MKNFLFCWFWLALLGQFAQIAPSLQNKHNYTIENSQDAKDSSGKLEPEEKKMEDKNFYVTCLPIGIPFSRHSDFYTTHFYKDIFIAPLALPPNG
jgi:hypothetical protein